MLSMFVTVLIVLAGVYIGFTMILFIYNEFTAKSVTYFEALAILLHVFPDACKQVGYYRVFAAAWTLSTTDDDDETINVLLGL
jgi:ABC-type spermidine/putrescine transport system permease subunit II